MRYLLGGLCVIFLSGCTPKVEYIPIKTKVPVLKDFIVSEIDITQDQKSWLVNNPTILRYIWELKQSNKNYSTQNNIVNSQYNKKR